MCMFWATNKLVLNSCLLDIKVKNDATTIQNIEGELYGNEWRTQI